MVNLSSHQDWPELLDRARVRRRARAEVLAIWPEGLASADLPAGKQLELEAAEAAVRDADKRHEELLARMQADLDT